MAMIISLLVILSLALVLLYWFLYVFFLLLYPYLQLEKVSSHGPPTYPIVGCLVSFYKNRHRILDWYTELLSESPTQTIMVHRLGARRTIVTANPDNVEYMLKTNFGNFPKGNPFTEILGDLLGRGIFNVDGALWHTQRKLASHEFTTKSLRELVVNMLESEANERLLPILESARVTGAVIDLQDLLTRFTFDIVCKVSLGTDPGYLDPSLPVSSLASAFDVAAEISARRAAAPVFAVWKAKRVLHIGSERQLTEAVELVRSSVTELIRNKRNESPKETNKDLLSRLILGGHDEEVIRDMVISFLMAGRDTTSAALTWLFWLLSCHSDTEKQVVNEVTSFNGLLNYQTLMEMKVMKACLCESMRLYPPVAWDSKHALDDDTLPDGTRVEKGDRVTYFPYGMGRMERVWGKDCEEFKPQRWFESNREELLKVSPFQFPVFQGGPRVCLGKEMAFIQMKYVVAKILSRFELKPVSLDRPVFVPLLTAHMAGGFKVVVRERNMESMGSLSNGVCMGSKE